jgi:hypothetical protein
MFSLLSVPIPRILFEDSGSHIFFGDNPYEEDVLLNLKLVLAGTTDSSPTAYLWL